MALNPSSWVPIQDYINAQKNIIPVETCYLYQSGYLGSPLNQGLRKGVLTKTLERMYLDMMQCFDQLPCLDKEIVVYRCIPSGDIPQLHVGDILTDKAFNSVSLKPKTYFGDVILRIQLGCQDEDQRFPVIFRKPKLIALTQHPFFIEDVYECILPCGMQYKVTSIENVVIDGKTYMMYNVTCIGYCESGYRLDNLFDVAFEELGNNILAHISGNTGKSRLSHNAVFMTKRLQHTFFSEEYELASFANINNLCEEKRKSPIFRLIYLYIDLLDNEIISLHKMTWVEARDRDLKKENSNLLNPLLLPQLLV